MDANAADVLKRLAYIEGHLKGIRRMVEEGQGCLAVMRQTYAVKRALDRLDDVLAGGYLDRCVHERRDGDVAGELHELFALAHRHCCPGR